MVGQFESTYLITSSEPDKIGFKLYADSIYDGTISRLGNVFPNRIIEGSWKMQSSTDIYTLLPCIVPEGETFEGEDSIANVSFIEDKMILEQFGRKIELEYWIDKTRRHIVHKPINNTGECRSIEISWLNDSVIFMSSNDSYKGITLKKE